MKRWLLRIALLLLLLLAFVIARAPAKHAIGYLSPSIKPTIISEPSGSIWRGQAGALHHPQIQLHNLNWDVNVLASLFSGPNAQLKANTENGEISGQAGLAWSQLGENGSLSLQDLNGIVPLADLPLPAIAKSIPLNGDIIVRQTSADMEQQWPVAANGQIAIANLTFEDQQQWQLGTLIADLETIDNGIKATLSSDSDKIQLSGIATLQHNGSYSVTADLNLDNDLPVVLRTMLVASGKRQADGSIRISYQGQIARPPASN